MSRPSPLAIKIASTIQCHDEPMPGLWFCGTCRYQASGSICLRCQRPRYEGSLTMRWAGPFGTCDQCLGPVLLKDGAASCPCGASEIPAKFMRPSTPPQRGG